MTIPGGTTKCISENLENRSFQGFRFYYTKLVLYGTNEKTFIQFWED